MVINFKKMSGFNNHLNKFDIRRYVMDIMMYHLAAFLIRSLYQAQKDTKKVYIEPEQEIIFKSLANARGVIEAEVIGKAMEREAGSISSRKNKLEIKAWYDLRVFIMSLIDKGPVL